MSLRVTVEDPFRGRNEAALQSFLRDIQDSLERHLLYQLQETNTEVAEDLLAAARVACLVDNKLHLALTARAVAGALKFHADHPRMFDMRVLATLAEAWALLREHSSARERSESPTEEANP